MDKVQFHRDPEFNSALPTGKKVNLKLKCLSLTTIKTLIHFKQE